MPTVNNEINIELGTTNNEVQITAVGTPGPPQNLLLTQRCLIHFYYVAPANTDAHYVPISTATSTDQSSLTDASTHIMAVMPYDGRVVSITIFQANDANFPTDKFELYIDGDDDDLTGDQRGSDLIFQINNHKGRANCPLDWVFSANEALSIKRSPSTTSGGSTTVTIVYELNMTT